MRVAQESITVFPDTGTREVVVVMAGLRLTFAPPEAHLLASALGQALQQIGVPDSDEAPPTASKAASSTAAASAAPEAAADAQRDVRRDVAAVIEEVEREVRSVFGRRGKTS